MITLNCKQMEPVMICHPDPEVPVVKEVAVAKEVESAAAAKGVEAAAEKEVRRRDPNHIPNRALALLTTVDRVR